MCTADNIQSCRWWKIWLVLYVVFMAGLHLIKHQIIGNCEGHMPGTDRVQGWEYLLYTMHHLVPTTIFLIPLSLICKKLLSDEKKDQVILTERQANLALEHKLVEALVPKKIAERLRNGDKHIADNYEDTTVLFIYLDGYEEEFRHDANLEKAMAWVQEVFYHIDEVLDKRFRNRILKVSAFQKFYLAVSGCPDKQVNATFAK
jgi:predicted house-cleaning noncanonical NTP pyrophosphatase (MazG superfamily)